MMVEEGSGKAEEKLTSRAFVPDCMIDNRTSSSMDVFEWN